MIVQRVLVVCLLVLSLSPVGAAAQTVSAARVRELVQAATAQVQAPA